MICWTGAQWDLAGVGGRVCFVCLFACFSFLLVWEEVEVPRESGPPEDGLNNDGRTNKEAGGGAFLSPLP